MPSMYVNVPKLEQGTKDALAAKLYDAAAPILKAPHIYTFVEAGPTKEEKVNALAESMQAAVQEVLGEDKKLTLVFHDNGLDRIAIGGVTIATKMQKK